MTKLATVGQLGSFVEKMKSQMALALPRHMNADRMTRLAMTEFSRNPALQKCSFNSIAACIMTASQLGLEIGVNGQAYMIPYGSTATFVPGWKGLIDLVNRAGRASCWTGAVFAGDEFDWGLGDSPYVKHKPLGESDPKHMLFAYAVGRVNGSEWPIIECWPNERLKKHFTKYNKVGDRHYAHQNWEMYARKIVLLQVMKYLPQSVELTAAIDAANAEIVGKPVTIDANFVTHYEEPQEAITDRSVESIVNKPSSSGTLADFRDGLQKCMTVGDINKLFSSIDKSKHSEDDLETMDRLAMDREHSLGVQS